MTLTLTALAQVACTMLACSGIQRSTHVRIFTVAGAPAHCTARSALAFKAGHSVIETTALTQTALALCASHRGASKRSATAATCGGT